MTNYEKYKNDIEKFTRLSVDFALDKGNKEIVQCAGLKCNNCVFNNSDGSCTDNKVEWADAEYIEEVDWSKVPVYTPILVSDDGKCWFRGYFACYKSETRKVFAWKDGCTSWSVDDGSPVIARRAPWSYAKLAEDELLGGIDCKKATKSGYEWMLEDGRIVKLLVEITEAENERK